MRLTVPLHPTAFDIYLELNDGSFDCNPMAPLKMTFGHRFNDKPFRSGLLPEVKRGRQLTERDKIIMRLRRVGLPWEVVHKLLSKL